MTWKAGANNTQSIDVWLDEAMVEPTARLADTGAAEGSYPLSHGLAQRHAPASAGWHR